MGQGITLFRQLQALLPWTVFHHAVAAVNGDRKVHVASCRSHFLVLLLSLLLRRHSLREIETGLCGRLHHLRRLGVGSVDRSSLSYANRHRPTDGVEAVFSALLRQARASAPGHPFPFPGKLYSLDATVIQVSATLFEWARCAPFESGVKLHLFLDHDGPMPCLIEFGTLRDSELAMARRRTYRSGSVLCFDQGYFDTAWFHTLDTHGVTFVTRLPPRPCYTVLSERPVPSGTGVLADEIIRFTSPGCRRQYPHALRLVTFCDPTSGDLLWFLTNQIHWSAITVCQVYKARWQIELFFKWLKQHLKLTHFYGRDENAIRWQVMVALCLYLLLALIKFRQRLSLSLYDLLRCLDQYLFDPVTLEELCTHQYQFKT